MASDDLRSKLTTRNLTIGGFTLILIGNSFAWTVWNVKLHEVLSNVGALILVVGVLQWFFDEESRHKLIDSVVTEISSYLSRRDAISRFGITECQMESKSITSGGWASELKQADTLVIGVHYSDGIVARFETIIQARIAAGKTTQILHSNPDGIAKNYLENCLSTPVDLNNRVNRLLQVVSNRFSNSTLVKTISHERVLRYSFVYSENFVWIIFITNTDGYEPNVPTMRISRGSDAFDFFKRDIRDLGASL